MNEIKSMTRQERIRAAKQILRRLDGEQRRKVCAEIPSICDFLEGKTSSCSTSCSPTNSPALADLTERLQTLAADLRRHGAAMNRKRREELRMELAKLDLLELAARSEVAETAA